MRALLWILVAEHAFALATPPYQPGVEHAFHLVFGLLYAWLALRLPGERRHRILLTVLLGIQFAGRFVVFALIEEPWIRASLIPGALITIVLVALLWKPRGSEAQRVGHVAGRTGDRLGAVGGDPTDG